MSRLFHYIQLALCTIMLIAAPVSVFAAPNRVLEMPTTQKTPEAKADAVQQAFLEQTRTRINTAITNVLNGLGAREQKIRNDNRLSEQRKTELLGDTQQLRSFLLSQQEIIRSAKTIEELKNNGGQIRQFMQNKQTKLQQQRDVLQTQVTDYKNQTQSIGTKMFDKLNIVQKQLQEEGTDTTTLNTLVERFKNTMNALPTSRTASQTIQDAKNIANNIISEVRRLLNK
ncbi:MAG TPA: hypothetical protein VJB65_04885 [Patescibacteria group bacterium]|nr:hypothetical protein [Patescibacteria group bacterium]